jgi:hypothetical protein
MPVLHPYLPLVSRSSFKLSPRISLLLKIGRNIQFVYSMQGVCKFFDEPSMVGWYEYHIRITIVYLT